MKNYIFFLLLPIFLISCHPSKDNGKDKSIMLLLLIGMQTQQSCAGTASNKQLLPIPACGTYISIPDTYYSRALSYSKPLSYLPEKIPVGCVLSKSTSVQKNYSYKFNSNNQLTNFSYNDLISSNTVTGPAFEYDSKGLLTKITETCGANSDKKTIEYTYQDNGNLNTTTTTTPSSCLLVGANPKEEVQYLNFDSSGLPLQWKTTIGSCVTTASAIYYKISECPFRIKQIVTQYDTSGCNSIKASSFTELLSYDTNGLLNHYSNSNTEKESFGYDSSHRVMQNTKETSGASGTYLDFQYTYSLTGTLYGMFANGISYLFE